MTICLLKSKIHRACVTGASVDYEGSLTIAADLAERVGLRRYERILVGNMANGERFETYVIYGPPGSGAIELNGATALLGKPGEGFSIGTGLIVTTPVGPLRLEVASQDLTGNWRFNLGVGWKF